MPNPIKDRARDIARAIDSAVENCIRKNQREMRKWHLLHSKYTYYQLRELKDTEFFKLIEESATAAAAHTSAPVHTETESRSDMENYAATYGLMGLQAAAKAGLNHVASPVALAAVHNPITAGSVTLVSAGGLGAALAPWMCAANILWEYRGNINPQNLHDVIRNTQYECRCKGSEGSERTDCDSVIKWIIDRKEYNLIVTATSIFLFGVPSLLQTGYRFARKEGKAIAWKFKPGDNANVVYASPARGAKWQADTDACQVCNTSFKDKMFIGKAGQRHHCRLCGNCCCSSCCSYEGPVLDPLERGEQVFEYRFLRGKVSNVRVCVSCLARMREQEDELKGYQAGPARMAQHLLNNAMPKLKSDRGCIRAAAAIFVLARGDLKKMLASLIATDGHSAVTRWAKL